MAAFLAIWRCWHFAAKWAAGRGDRFLNRETGQAISVNRDSKAP